MAGKRKRPNGWEYVFKRAGVLDKPLYMTFATEEEGDAYAERLEALLDRGIVPTEHKVESRVLTLSDLFREYTREAHPSAKDISALKSVEKTRGWTPLLSINAGWVDDWITELKRVECLVPATIRAKVGAVARATDWGMRKKLLILPDHPFRTLPDGYAQYTELDAKIAGVAKQDTERDRRLEPGEHEKILEVITGGVLPRKQRPLALPDKAAMRLLYILALESAMRLREMYTLTLEQVALQKSTIFLDRTKNGDKRQVPLSSVAKAEITAYLEVREIPAEHPRDLLFPWWNGVHSEKVLREVTDYLSGLFHDNRSPGVFDAAGCVGLKFHDLRHEATSRLFERTNLSESQIMKITGHKSHRMMMRYANLRGSDLASHLW